MDSKKEQLRRFEQLRGAVGEPLCYFYQCIAQDVPFSLAAVPEEGSEWEDYLSNLEQVLPRWRQMDFCRGETDVTGVLAAGAGQMERWANLWGEYSEEDYRRLDAIFATYASRLQRAGGMDALQEDTLRSCSQMRLSRDKALAKGGKENLDMARQLNKMIQDNLAAENLRKKDEKPVEELRIDTLVDALEKAGFLEQGKILPLPDVQRVLLERLGALGGKPSHRFAYTLDAADQMLMMILNDIRGNDGLPELSELPDNMRFDQNVACEFAPAPNEDELAAYEALGLVPMERTGRGKKGKQAGSEATQK